MHTRFRPVRWTLVLLVLVLSYSAAEHSSIRLPQRIASEIYPHLRAAPTLLTATACPDNNSGNGVNASCSRDTSSATLLVISYSTFAGSAATVTDSKGITWTCKTFMNTNAYSKQMCYAWPGSTGWSIGASHTITVSSSSGFVGATFSAWSGTKTSADPFDGEAPSTNSANTSGTAGPITPTGGANDLFVTSGVGHGTTEFDAATVDSPFAGNMAARQVYVGGSSLGDQLWYATGTGATSATWHFTLSAYNLDMLAFLPAPGGSTPTPCTLLLTGIGSC